MMMVIVYNILVFCSICLEDSCLEMTAELIHSSLQEFQVVFNSSVEYVFYYCSHQTVKELM